jgi:dTDP-4-amino-4,6-dideoxygalactose transaminase
MSYISTGLCVALNNNKIKFSDIDDETGLISLESVKKNLSKNTKVIIPVNLYGQKVNIKLLRQIVGKKIYIIEDSAQSHFASSCQNCKNSNHSLCFKRENSHKYANLSCYSFYPSKNLGAYGDGGIITTDNINLYKKISILRNLGTVKKNVHQYEGLNSRLDTIQASILLEKVKYTPEHNDHRRKISEFYDQELVFVNDVKLTVTDPGSSRHLYVIRVRERDKLAKYLIKNNISIQFHYPYSLNKTGTLKNKIRKVKLINSEKWARECLSLPLFPYMSLNEAKRVVLLIKKFYKA